MSEASLASKCDMESFGTFDSRLASRSTALMTLNGIKVAQALIERVGSQSSFGQRYHVTKRYARGGMDFGPAAAFVSVPASGRSRLAIACNLL